VVSGNVWRHVTWYNSEEVGFADIYRVEARDVVKHPEMHGTFSRTIGRPKLSIVTSLRNSFYNNDA
jgi:hypothetical protein